MVKGEGVLGRIARRYLGDGWRRFIWPRLEIIGDIVVIRRNLVSGFPVEIEKLREMGDALLNEIVNVKSVWLAYTPVREYGKTRRFIHLAGEERTVTVYREHGCRFMLDIKGTYFSPRLNYEHGWFAEHVGEDEYILNMFAGVGFFSIIPACKKRARSVAIDLNPIAYKFLLKNILMNKVDRLVNAVHGDAGVSTLSMNVENEFDHVIMPFPEKALHYIPFAYKAVRNGGELHVFLHHHIEGPATDVSGAVLEVIRRLKCLKPANVELIRARLVRTVGPRLGQYIVSLKIGKSGV